MSEPKLGVSGAPCCPAPFAATGVGVGAESAFDRGSSLAPAPRGRLRVRGLGSSGALSLTWPLPLTCPPLAFRFPLAAAPVAAGDILLAAADVDRFLPAAAPPAATAAPREGGGTGGGRPLLKVVAVGDA